MTPRQRFHETMSYGQPDRVPLLEEGLRDDVLERWNSEGLDTDLATLFCYDRRERIEVDLSPRPDLVRPIVKRSDLSALRRCLDVNAAERYPGNWSGCVEGWRERCHLLELPIHHGLFRSMGVDDWKDLEVVLEFLADNPTLVRDIMDIYADFAAGVAERILRDVKIDFASLSEPIGGNNGTLISPGMYRQIVLESYEPVFDVLQHHGVETIVFMTYANAEVLLPDVLDAGFNCLWAMETETEAMNYRRLRRRLGKSLRLIGGIDLDCLRMGDEAIERELLEKVPPLLEEGGYIPVADGRIRADIPFTRYAHYRRVLERVTGVSAHDRNQARTTREQNRPGF